MSRYGSESKAEGQVVKSEMRRDHGEGRRQMMENSPAKAMADVGIKVKDGGQTGISSKRYSNEADMSAAVKKLGRDTERGKHAPMVGGHKNDHKTH